MKFKNEFMAEFQSLLLIVAQNVEGLSVSDGEEFERLARRAAVMVHSPAKRILSLTNRLKGGDA